VPCIAIAFEADGRSDAAVQGLASGNVDWVVITSANAVTAVAGAAGRLRVDLATRAGGTRWAAIGRATAAAMREAGMPVDFQPDRANGLDLAASLPMKPGTRVLLPRGDLADATLPAALEARGAVVTSVVAYRTQEAPVASISLMTTALAESPVAIVVTSGSTVRGLLALAAAIGAEQRVRAIPVVAIGPGTAAEATRLGFDVAADAGNLGPGAVADAVAAVALPMATVR
jgi:uroporphyrinogen-III synthase